MKQESKKRQATIREAKRQNDTVSTNEEAEKLNRLKAELASSRGLTEVASDFHLFEMAANVHFNKHMNKLQTLDGITNDTKFSTTNLAT